MNSAQLLLAAGAGILLLLGLGHGLMTLADTVRPRFFTPVDDRVRVAMQGARRIRMQGRLPLSAASSLWRAWLGFNLSHSLGAVVFSLSLLTLALQHFPLFADSSALRLGVVLVPAAYLAISLRFWFIAPTIGIGLALLCLAAAAVLA